MKNAKLIPVILSGGGGSRLWPLSREQYPKQLLRLTNDHSLLQNTLQRAKQMQNSAGDTLSPLSPLIVTNEAHRFLIAEQLQQIDMTDAQLILEPVARNTAPAIALAALHLQQNGDDAVMLVMPSDHIMNNVEALTQSIERGYTYAQAGKLVTFGIKPTAADTGYGYIQANASDDDAMTIKAFIEKPARDTAEQLIQDKHCFWNSGIFMFTPAAFLAALKQHAPAVFNGCQTAMGQSQQDGAFIRPAAEAFSTSDSISIDHAVMEKCDNGVVIPLATDWVDIGTWPRLLDSAPKNQDQNVIIGDVIAHDTSGSYISSQHRKLVTVGVKDHVIVETPDAILVAHKDACDNNLKTIVNDHIKPSQDDSFETVYRPWGSYTCIERGPHFLVKRLRVNPNSSLSLQLHEHRSEHWVVVSGIATVTVDEKEFELQENESTFVPVNTKHRLSNQQSQPLEIIEIQTGTTLSESDIIRFDDQYGRHVQKVS